MASIPFNVPPLSRSVPSQENPMTFSGSAWILEQEIGTKMSNQNPAPAERASEEKSNNL